MSLENTYLVVTFSDQTKWEIPVMVIAKNRADHYSDDFEGDAGRSLREDTIPLFVDSPYEIQDWAQNNMDWDELKPHARKVEQKLVVPNYDQEWGCAKTEVWWEHRRLAK